ncbi:MAG: CHAT domain-containing protein, partial [Calditrichaeota bacterium]|nr:CHAT domain-containing protein [Calditrichota bacterium]
DAGVPAVIGTAQPIDDQAATLLSIQFYESLAAGRTLDQAWQAAEAKVKTRTGAESGYRVRGGIRRKDEPRV